MPVPEQVKEAPATLLWLATSPQVAIFSLALLSSSDWGGALASLPSFQLALISAPLFVIAFFYTATSALRYFF